MTTTTKQPNLDSAAIVARTISRALAKKGFVRARLNGHYYLNEGFTVHRCGYASTVVVDVHIKETGHYIADTHRREDTRTALRIAVIAMGYVPREYPTRACYIDCLNS